jgi:ribulose-bisphosphate carboxylase large chain
VLDIYGTEMVLLVSGGIHGHPKGTRAGAQATMQAIEAWKEGITLDEKARNAKALAEALEKWGYYKPM